MPSPEVEVFAVQRRRRFAAAEKQRLVEETLQPEMSVSLVARKHGISPSLLFRWRRLASAGALSAVGADDEVVPASEAKRYISKSVNYSACWARKPRDGDPPRSRGGCPGKKVACALAVIDGGRHPLSPVCRALGIARSNVMQLRASRSRIDRRGRPTSEEPQLVAELTELASKRLPTAIGGYGLCWTGIGGKKLPPVNVKRVYRLIRANSLLLQRYTGAPPMRVYGAPYRFLEATSGIAQMTSKSPVTMVSGCAWSSA